MTRRLIVVTLLYGVGALLVDAVLRAVMPVLVLPASTLPLGRGLLVLGFVVTLAAAWRYTPSDG